MFKRFGEWIKVRESSPITRLKWDAALGLKPPIAPASVNSKASGLPWQVDALKDTPVAGEENKKPTKKKKAKKKPAKKTAKKKKAKKKG